MNDAKKIFEICHVFAFVGGAVTALLVPKALKSGRARKVAVCAAAKGMQLRNDARSVFEGLREDARDIYHEAREQAGNEARGENAKDGI